jgi:predicted nucleotidyltransferase
MIKNTIINRGVIKKIAVALGEINEQVVYVGGAVVSLYINDPAADDVRPTKDIDISMSLVTLGELETMRERLTAKGFIQRAEDDVICRFRYDDVQVDVMNTRDLGWAPANPWFASGFLNRELVEVENQRIQILPLPYFLASKFSAYHGRGNNEPRTSPDFEDIVYILDNRVDLVEQILAAKADVKDFLGQEFKTILGDGVRQEAIAGNLFYETRTARLNRILEKVNQIVTTL